MHASEAAGSAAIIHRQIVRLVFLVFVAVAAFFLTRAIAASNRDLNLRNAAEWYARGEAAARAGDLDQAIDAFRRAIVRNRDNTTYQLALARTLIRRHEYDAGRALLLSIRDSAPENAPINLDLARVAAARQDVTEAIRFYHDALYAPWPATEADARRAVRIELIRFLLTHDQTGRAWAEVLAAEAGSADQALHGADADLVDLVMSHDPMAPRIRSRERQRRLAADVSYAAQRLSECGAGTAPTASAGADAATLDQLHALAEQLGRSTPLDQDTLESGLDLIARAERDILAHCERPTDTDLALRLIAREHGAINR